MNLPGQEMLAGFLGGRGAQPGPSPEVREFLGKCVRVDSRCCEKRLLRPVHRNALVLLKKAQSVKCRKCSASTLSGGPQTRQAIL